MKHRRLTLTAVIALCFILILCYSPLITMIKSGISWFLFQVMDWQSTAMRALHRAFQNGQTIALAVLSFAYGCLHSAGPGHGKAIITTWIATQREQYRHILFISILGAFLQAVSALFWVGITVGMTNWFIRDSLNATHYLIQISNLIIILTGAYLLIPRKHQCECCPPHEPTSHPNARLLASLAIGIRPCSGALIILSVAIARGEWITGMVMTLLMASGTAITISAIGTLIYLGKHTLANRLLTPLYHHWLKTIGAILLILLGIILFISTLNHRPITTPLLSSNTVWLPNCNTRDYGVHS